MKEVRNVSDKLARSTLRHSAHRAGHFHDPLTDKRIMQNITSCLNISDLCENLRTGYFLKFETVSTLNIDRYLSPKLGKQTNNRHIWSDTVIENRRTEDMRFLKQTACACVRLHERIVFAIKMTPSYCDHMGLLFAAGCNPRTTKKFKFFQLLFGCNAEEATKMSIYLNGMFLRCFGV